jgi:hypothetical protein
MKLRKRVGLKTGNDQTFLLYRCSKVGNNFSNDKTYHYLEFCES